MNLPKVGLKGNCTVYYWVEDEVRRIEFSELQYHDVGISGYSETGNINKRLQHTFVPYQSIVSILGDIIKTNK